MPVLQRIRTKQSSVPQRISIADAKRLGLDIYRFRGERRGKYNNRRTEYRGRLYDSAREAARARELDILLANGHLKEWRPQYEIKIFYNGTDICSYFADFRVVFSDGTVVYEDVKGFRTDVYKLKKKLVKAFYGIDIKET